MVKKRKEVGYTKAIKRAFEKYRWWDYGYMIDFELAIWKHWCKMYGERKHTHLNDEHSRKCHKTAKLAISLIEIFEGVCLERVEKPDGMMFDLVLKKGIYINTRNMRRFVNTDGISEKFLNSPCMLSDLRSCKAWHCYCLLREYRLMEMWD